MARPRVNSMRALFDASHPGPVLAVVAASIGYAIALGRSPAGDLFVGLAVLAGQLSIGWQNDLLDAARDIRAARTDKPIATGRIGRSTVAGAALVAAIATVPLSMLSGWRAGFVHLVAVISAWTYNAWLKGSIFSFVPFLVSFGLLPVFVSFGMAGSPWPPWWASTAAAMLGVAAHLLNALPDREADLSEHLLGIAHRMPGPAALVSAAILLWGSSAVLALGPGPLGLWSLLGLGVTTVLATIGCGLALGGRGRLPFRAVLLIALIDVAILISRIHHHG